MSTVTASSHASPAALSGVGVRRRERARGRFRRPPGAAAAAGYGGAITMQRAIYLGVIQRLLFAGAALGLGLLKLSPLPPLAPFVVAQFGFLANVWPTTNAQRKKPD